MNDVDLVTHLVDLVGQEVAAESQRRREAGAVLDSQDERLFARTALVQQIRLRNEAALSSGRTPLNEDEEQALISTVLNSVFGLGGLEKYFNDPNVQDIHVNGFDSVFVVYQHGVKVKVDPIASNDEQLRQMISDYVRRSSRIERRFDRSNPVVDMQLPNGDRLNATFGVSSRPTMTIRRHNFTLNSLDQLRDLGSIDPVAALFLAAAVKAKMNIVVSGGTGSGKTTLLRALIREIPRTERIITVEDSFELGLARLPDAHEDLVEYEARPANLEGVGEISVAQLVVNSLRANPDRIIVGESRGEETMSVILAMSQGNDGSMTTLHADSSKNALSRISTYCAIFHDPPMDPQYTVGLIRDAIHFVVHLERRNGQRRVQSIREVDSTTEANLLSTEVFAANADGLAVPAFGVTSQRHKEALEAAGFDARLASGAARLRVN